MKHRVWDSLTARLEESSKLTSDWIRCSVGLLHRKNPAQDVFWSSWCGNVQAFTSIIREDKGNSLCGMFSPPARACWHLLVTNVRNHSKDWVCWKKKNYVPNCKTSRWKTNSLMELWNLTFCHYSLSSVNIQNLWRADALSLPFKTRSNEIPQNNLW